MQVFISNDFIEVFFIEWPKKLKKIKIMIKVKETLAEK